MVWFGWRLRRQRHRMMEGKRVQVQEGRNESNGSDWEGEASLREEGEGWRVGGGWAIFLVYIWVGGRAQTYHVHDVVIPLIRHISLSIQIDRDEEFDLYNTKQTISQ